MAELHKTYIEGASVSGTSETESRNPSDVTDLVGMYAQASASQLADALQAAARAQIEWATYGLERKHAVLMNIGTELMSWAEEMGTLLGREEGKIAR